MFLLQVKKVRHRQGDGDGPQYNGNVFQLEQDRRNNKGAVNVSTGKSLNVGFCVEEFICYKRIALWLKYGV